MERIRVSKYFYLDEFIDPHTYFNTKDNGRSLLDFRVVVIAQELRGRYGFPLYINTWWRYYKEKERTLSCDEIIKLIEGSSTLRKWSGTRTERCTIGAKNSAHRSFQAIDVVGDETILFDIVKKNAELFYELGVRRLEDISITPGWLHLDTKEHNTQPNSIRVVDLKAETQTIRW